MYSWLFLELCTHLSWTPQPGIWFPFCRILCSSYLFTFLSLTLPNFYSLTLSSSPPHSSSPHILIPLHNLHPLTFSHPHLLTPSPHHTHNTPAHPHPFIDTPYPITPSHSHPSPPHPLPSSLLHRMHHSIPLCSAQPWRMWWNCRVPSSQTTPSLGSLRPSQTLYWNWMDHRRKEFSGTIAHSSIPIQWSLCANHPLIYRNHIFHGQIPPVSLVPELHKLTRQCRHLFTFIIAHHCQWIQRSGIMLVLSHIVLAFLSIVHQVINNNVAIV